MASDTPSNKQTIYNLLSVMTPDTEGYVDIGAPTIAKTLALSVRHVYRLLDQLTDEGRVRRQPRAGKTTLYQIVPLTSTPDMTLDTESYAPLTFDPLTPDTMSGVATVTEGAHVHTSAELKALKTNTNTQKRTGINTSRMGAHEEVSAETNKRALELRNAFSDAFPLEAMPTETARYKSLALSMAAKGRTAEQVKAKTRELIAAGQAPTMWDVSDALDKGAVRLYQRNQGIEVVEKAPKFTAPSPIGDAYRRILDYTDDLTPIYADEITRNA